MAGEISQTGRILPPRPPVAQPNFASFQPQGNSAAGNQMFQALAQAFGLGAGRNQLPPDLSSLFGAGGALMGQGQQAIPTFGRQPRVVEPLKKTEPEPEPVYNDYAGDFARSSYA